MLGGFLKLQSNTLFPYIHFLTDNRGSKGKNSTRWQERRKKKNSTVCASPSRVSHHWLAEFIPATVTAVIHPNPVLAGQVVL